MFETGNVATVMRGKLRGHEVEILGPAVDESYPVKIKEGGYAVINAVNLKAPAEGTIGAGRLAAEIQTAVGDAQTQDARSTLAAFVSRLEADIPGLGGRISWPAEG